MLDELNLIWYETDPGGEIRSCHYNEGTREYHLSLEKSGILAESQWPRQDYETLYTIGPLDEQVAELILEQMREKIRQEIIKNLDME